MEVNAPDLEPSQGLISEEGFKQLLDAEIFPTATPLQWFESEARS
jgi:hypothetical protein